MPARWGRTGIAWATLALAVSEAIDALEARSGAGVQLTELRPIPGRQAVRMRALLIGAGSLEAITAEVSVPMPTDQLSRAIRPAFTFLTAAASGGRSIVPAASRHGGMRMPTSRRPSRSTKRTSRRVR